MSAVNWAEIFFFILPLGIINRVDIIYLFNLDFYELSIYHLNLFCFLFIHIFVTVDFEVFILYLANNVFLFFRIQIFQKSLPVLYLTFKHEFLNLILLLKKVLLNLNIIEICKFIDSNLIKLKEAILLRQFILNNILTLLVSATECFWYITFYHTEVEGLIFIV